MRAALHCAEGGPLGLKELEQKLQIKRGQSVAVVNAPPESGLRLLAAARPDPDHADIVIGFAARAVDLAWLRPAYAAAHAGRVVWVSYPKPGRPGTDLRRDWLIRALRRYGVDAVEDVSIDHTWSALRLQSVRGVAALARNRKGRALCDSLRQDAVFLQNIVQRLPGSGNPGHLQ